MYIITNLYVSDYCRRGVTDTSALNRAHRTSSLYNACRLDVFGILLYVILYHVRLQFLSHNIKFLEVGLIIVILSKRAAYLCGRFTT